jgi:hypothetical protein
MAKLPLKSLAFALLIAVVGLLMTAQFSAKLPFAYAFGCDSFGYLRQAELFRQNGSISGLNTAINTENASFLVGIAKQINPLESRWAEMIAPHCHHFKSGSENIILQYPPGTGFVLSLLPKGKELECLALLLVFSIMVWWGRINFATRSASVFLISTVSVAILLATVGQFHVPSYSVPLTILLLVWIATLLFEIDYAATPKNLLFITVIGLLTGSLLTVRVASLIVLPAIAAIVCLQIVEARRQKSLSIIAPILGVSSFALATVPLLTANWLNTGGIFDSTYNDYDKKLNFNNTELLLNNVSYYLLENRAAALAILSLSVVTLAVLTTKNQQRTSYWAALSLIAIFVTNLLFLSFKMVAIDYYFLPTAVLCLCVGLPLYSKGYQGDTTQPAKFARSGMLVFVLLLLALVLYRFQTTPHRDDGLSVPKSLLAPDSIVYADNSGGAISYYQKKYTAKINFGTPCMRDQLISRVHAAGRAQYFVNDSVKMNEAITAIGVERFKIIGSVSSAHFAYDVLALLPFDANAIPKIICDFGSEPEIVREVRLQPSGSVVGDKFIGQVAITNFSTTAFSTLPNAFPIKLSWRFVALDAQQAAPDWSARQDLRLMLAPGVAYPVSVSITVPEKAGNYALEFSLVQEGWAWFHERGMPIASVKIHVDTQATSPRTQ